MSLALGFFGSESSVSTVLSWVCELTEKLMWQSPKKHMRTKTIAATKTDSKADLKSLLSDSRITHLGWGEHNTDDFEDWLHA